MTHARHKQRNGLVDIALRLDYAADKIERADLMTSAWLFAEMTRPAFTYVFLPEGGIGYVAIDVILADLDGVLGARCCRRCVQ